jgi:hypothetical protein
MSECSVCCKTTLQLSTCVHCNFLACKTCLEKYSLELVGDLDCMNCKRPLDRHAQLRMFTKKFVTQTYKRRREDLWFDREMTLMPSTQDAAAKEKRRRRIVSEVYQLQKQYDEIISAAHKIQTEMRLLNRSMYVIPDGDKVSHLSIRCAHENCRGYLSSAYKCGACEQYTCSSCLEPKNTRDDPVHVCDPGKVESVRLIARECRPCPSCQTRVFKTEGCNQMFCVVCNTLFDWVTLRQVNHSNGHNPHFLEWVRHTGGNRRDVGDVICGGMPDLRLLTIRVRQEDVAAHEDITELNNLYYCIQHVHHYERPVYPINWSDDETSKSLRVKWLLGDITTEEFKSTRQRMEKRSQLNREIGLVLEMFVNACTDIFQRLVADLQSTVTYTLEECRHVRIMANLQFQIIEKDYGNMAPNISSAWIFKRKYHYNFSPVQ